MRNVHILRMEARKHLKPTPAQLKAFTEVSKAIVKELKKKK